MDEQRNERWESAMITHKIREDGKIAFRKPCVPPDDPFNFYEFVVLDARELMELAKAVQMAEFEYCRKFKCSLDQAKCF
jgi:hypothetical protein